MEKIKILSQEWDIIYDTNVLNLYESDGICLYTQNKLVINPNQSITGLKLSILHESLHAMLRNLGRHDLSDDETLVHSLSEALTIAFEIELKK